MNPKRRTKTKAPGVYRSVSALRDRLPRSTRAARVQGHRGWLRGCQAARPTSSASSHGRADPPDEPPLASSPRPSMPADWSPATLAHYRWALDAHLLPRFRNRNFADITTDDVARLVAEMARGVQFKKVDGRLVRRSRETGYSGRTTTGVLSTLGLVLGKAKRRGLIPANPVGDLERGERPDAPQPRSECSTMPRSRASRARQASSGR